ncbi:TetR/AcrR family transcriptional regulator [Actinomadura sp. B10D3]|uniref:TetR/AcrR family transcriptional regulator n=1 Tax=Actinomadura sp. B10D3 TaxID=3153557 RepID=UPI00325F93C0
MKLGSLPGNRWVGEMIEYDDDSVEERLFAAAARLFSELGYDATDTAMIAEASGVGTREVIERYGGRRGLYLSVLERAGRQRVEFMDGVMAEFTYDTDGLVRMFDRYLDYCMAHREFPGLWMHRWLADASDLPSPDVHFGGAMLGRWIAQVDRVIADDLDAGMTIRMLVWYIHAFAEGGLVDSDGHRVSPDDVHTLQRLRSHLHNTIRHLAP